MTTTLTRSPSARAPAGDELRLEAGRSRRRPWLAVGSLVVMATCAAAFSSLYVKAGHQTRVLVVVRFVAQGSALEADDLTAASMSLSPAVASVRATDVGDVIGRAAGVDLLPGTLLTRASLGTGMSPPSGSALVGVTAKASQLPADGVSPGERVDVVLTGPPGTPDAGLGPAVDTGGAPGPGSPGSVVAEDVVVSNVVAAQSSSGTDTAVTLVVPTSEVSAVANASAAGQAALVVVPARS